MAKKAWWAFWRRETVQDPVAPAKPLQSIILRPSSELPAAESGRAIEVSPDAEPALNYALRVVAEGMAMEGIITKRQARDFVGEHALIVASKERGLAALLRTVRTSEEAIRSNQSRILLVRLPESASPGDD